MYRKKYSLCRVQYYPWFQACTGGLGAWIRGEYCTELPRWKPGYSALRQPTGRSTGTPDTGPTIIWEPTDEFSSNYHLIATVREAPEKNHPSKRSQPIRLWGGLL